MCGIVGVISAHLNGFSLGQKEMFQELLYVDALRGMDSTGMIMVDRDGDVDMLKEACDASSLSWYDEYRSFFSGATSRGKALIGHNRKKTVGKVEDKTAHPFIVNDEFLFVHNGTLLNHKELGDTDVDSEALAQVIHKAMKDDNYIDLEEALQKVRGAYALAWYDMRHEKLYLLRNKERPLWLAELEYGGYAFASEPGFVYAIANRNNVRIKEISSVDEHTLMSLDVLKYNADFVKQKLEVKPYVFPTPRQTNTPTGRGAILPTGKTSATNYGDEGLSKNAFKKLKHRWINRQARVVVEDYVEKYPPQENSKNQDLFLWGSILPDPNNPDTYVPNIVEAVVSDKDMDDIVENYNGIVVGLISEMEYDPVGKRVVITLTGPKNLEEKKNENKVSVH
jgi:hypothetical protein